MRVRSFTVWIAVLSAMAATGGSLFTAGDPFKLLLLHTNDMHARFEQVSRTAGKCSEYEAANNLCYGGFARVQTAIRQEMEKARSRNIPTLSLNAGDTYQGTVWYAVGKWQVVVHFLKMLPIEAMCLGNHEFDDGIQGLVPFLNAINTTIVTGNLNATLEPTLANSPLKRFVVVEKAGRKIGIIGYLTPETKVLGNAGKVQFIDEIEYLKMEAKYLKNLGVDIIIALGHSGYEMDMKIAREVPDVDVIVGGHSHSFLYTGPPPDIENPVDRYPVIVTQPNGRKVAMVQAYAFTKYLGKVELTFDGKGELTNAEGNPILLDYKIPEDPTILASLKQWQSKLNSTLREKIGLTTAYLEGGYLCRFYECNLGNLITDSYIHHEVKKYAGPYWTRAAIAIQQAGGIRASINATGSNRIITREDVITSMPFFSSLSVVKLQGKYLKEALEWSVARYDVKEQQGKGEFLQVSGLKIFFDMTRPVGSRAVTVHVRCSECYIPTYEPISLWKDYLIIMPTFLLNGGDSFDVFKKHGVEVEKFELMDTDVTISYILNQKILYHGVEGRIQINKYVVSSSFAIKPSLIYLFPILFIIKLF